MRINKDLDIIGGSHQVEQLITETDAEGEQDIGNNQPHKILYPSIRD